MANPQKENGHLDIANEIVDFLAKYRIPGEEMQIIWVVLRKTWGWHKKKDMISLSQFQKLTNLKRSTVCRAINNLVSKKILYSLKSETGGSTNYIFNKNYSKWKPSLKKETSSLKSETGGSLKNDNKVVSKKRHTKETITKETITKEIKDIYLTFFDTRFWINYPKRNNVKAGKTECFEFIYKNIKQEEFDDLEKATKNYADSEQAKNNYAKDPIRFLKKNYWKDWIAFSPPKPKTWEEMKADLHKKRGI